MFEEWLADCTPASSSVNELNPWLADVPQLSVAHMSFHRNYCSEKSVKICNNKTSGQCARKTDKSQVVISLLCLTRLEFSLNGMEPCTKVDEDAQSDAPLYEHDALQLAPHEVDDAADVFGEGGRPDAVHDALLWGATFLFEQVSRTAGTLRFSTPEVSRKTAVMRVSAAARICDVAQTQLLQNLLHYARQMAEAKHLRCFALLHHIMYDETPM
eukprot:3893291-Amphidinium_carterae.1